MFVSSNNVVSVCFSSDGKQIASGSWDTTVKIWNASSGELQSTLRVDGLVSSLDFSPCGSKIAAAFNVLDDEDDFVGEDAQVAQPLNDWHGFIGCLL